MELPTIYYSDVSLIFASALASIAVMWAIKKSLDLVFEFKL